MFATPLAKALLAIVSGVLVYLLAWMPFAGLQLIAGAVRSDDIGKLDLTYWSQPAWPTACLTYAIVLGIILVATSGSPSPRRTFTGAIVATACYAVALGAALSSPDEWGNSIMYMAVMTVAGGPIIFLLGIPVIIVVASRVRHTRMSHRR